VTHQREGQREQRLVRPVTAHDPQGFPRHGDLKDSVVAESREMDDVGEVGRGRGRGGNRG
jgi:hypothetical protein